MNEKQKRYRLLVDLTDYSPGFKAGAIGVEGPDHLRGFWARAQDRFFPMQLPDGSCIDVLWKSVEVVTEDTGHVTRGNTEAERLTLQEITDLLARNKTLVKQNALLLKRIVELNRMMTAIFHKQDPPTPLTAMESSTRMLSALLAAEKDGQTEATALRATINHIKDDII